MSETRFEEFCRAVHTAYRFGRQIGCKAFDKTLVPLEWFRKYISNRDNIMLFEDEEMPGRLLAAVFRGEHTWHGVERSVYAIVVSRIPNKVLKQFVIAHEFGHIFLHGRILAPGTFMAKSAQHWGDEHENSLRRTLEVEANIFALLMLVPTAVIESLEKVLGKEVSVPELQHAVSRLYEWNVDLSLVRERLLIYRILKADPATLTNATRDRAIGSEEKDEMATRLRAEFDQLLATRSWSIDGVEVMRRQQERAGPPPPALSEAAWAKLKAGLLQTGVISADEFVFDQRDVAS